MDSVGPFFRHTWGSFVWDTELAPAALPTHPIVEGLIQRTTKNLSREGRPDPRERIPGGGNP